jgi:hypothetical protein
MASNLFGPGSKPERTAQDIVRAQAQARAEDARQRAAAAAAGRDRRSIGRKR